MEYRFRISQDDLNTLYESSRLRLDAHPELAERHKEIIQKYPFFESEKEALEYAIKMINENYSDYQIWVKIEKEEDIIHIQKWWIVTDDWKIKQSADYLGMALMYDSTRLQNIIYDNIKIDDVIAYY